jgi:hypothetical protein
MATAVRGELAGSALRVAAREEFETCARRPAKAGYNEAVVRQVTAYLAEGIRAEAWAESEAA